jgi:glycerate 2-kinase
MNTQQHIMKIAGAAIQSVSPYDMIRKRVQLHGHTLTVKAGGSEPLSLHLSSYDNIYIIGAGKATAPMAKALEEILGSRISAGVIAVKPGHTAELAAVRQIEGGHPVPNEGSAAAAREIAEIAGRAGESDLVINIISGGGSALLTLPHEGISLEDLQAATRELLSCGAPIEEMNCIRKHLSGIKGGRLADRIYPAESVSLILSDVVGDDLQSIASGLTVPDRTSYVEALRIVDKYGIGKKLPPGVMALLNAGAAGTVPETPKPEAECFTRTKNVLLGTNAVALQTAAAEAQKLGYRPIVLTSKVTGEAREIAKFYAALAREAAAAGPDNAEASGLAAALTGTAASESGVSGGGGSGVGIYKKPLCILAGGETTVTLRGAGKGGRNQEMALAVLAEISALKEAFSGIVFASVATDGNDGPTDAAGAYASAELADRAEGAGLSINEYLTNNDAYTFFAEIDGLIKTGPTNTNVCDLQILLAD